MQLVILTTNGTCSSFKKLNEELQITSHRLKTCKYNSTNYKSVCAIQIRGRYVRSKSIVDTDVIEFMKYQFKQQLKEPSNKKYNGDPLYHTCLHVYAHDGTFGLLRRRLVPLDKKKAVLRAHQFVQIILDYLVEHPECTKIKLHVCFSGYDYNSTELAYGELVRDELEKYMSATDDSPAILSQSEITIEASNGWSILGKKEENSFKWSHFVLPNTEEMGQFVFKDNHVDYQTLINSHGLHKQQGKPKWTARS
jgi:hypothetical protein